MTVADRTSEPLTSLRATGAAAVATRAALVAWPAALVAAVYWTVGRIGFNPTDQGFILAAAHRILLGEVPHRDFISPRPLGSPLMHTLDFFLPGPLFETSTVLGIAEIVAYSLVLGTLVLGVGPLRWRPLQAAAVGAAALVNMHKFPLMVWHTVDGLLLVSAGFLLVHRGVRGRTWNLWLGFMLLGAACTVKQSFLVAPVIAMPYAAFGLRNRLQGGPWSRLAHAVAALAALGLFLAAVGLVAFPAPAIAHGLGHPARAAAVLAAAGAALAAFLLVRARPLFGPVLLAAVAGALPVAAYVAVIAALGGLPELRTQLSSAAPAYGLDPIREVLAPQARAVTAAVVAAAAGLALARRLVERSSGPGPLAASLGVRLVLSGLVVGLVLSQRLATGGTWGTLTVLAFAALAAVDLGWTRDLSRAWPAVAVLACAWMATLSWGYFWPDLVAGSVALAALVTIWREAPVVEPPRQVAMALTALGAAGVVAVGAVFLYARWTQPGYLEPAAASVNAPLGDVSPAFGQVRTDAVTHEYLLQIRQCVAAHPASRVAVLPDNAAIYPALGLDDPLPIDWFYEPEYVGSEAQMLAAARRLDRDGHFLVLYETVYASELIHQRDLPAATPALVDRLTGDQPLLVEVRATLHGEPVTCGSFAGVYRP